MKFIKGNSSKKFYFIIKSIFDFIFSFIFIILGSPLFLLIAILIKLSSRGPILYHHKRIGKNFKTFNCLKFRTMHPEAEDILQNLLNKNPKIKKEFEATQKIKNDPRITIIGKFLRKTSLDELPQFINVLRMEMSIVGPRPIIKEEIIRYETSISKVLSLRPGITGLWQVSGRNNLSYKKRVFLDSLYIDKINPIMDLRIILRTLGVLLLPLDRGAY